MYFKPKPSRFSRVSGAITAALSLAAITTTLVECDQTDEPSESSAGMVLNYRDDAERCLNDLRDRKSDDFDYSIRCIDRNLVRANRHSGADLKRADIELYEGEINRLAIENYILELQLLQQELLSPANAYFEITIERINYVMQKIEALNGAPFDLEQVGISMDRINEFVEDYYFKKAEGSINTIKSFVQGDVSLDRFLQSVDAARYYYSEARRLTSTTVSETKFGVQEDQLYDALIQGIKAKSKNGDGLAEVYQKILQEEGMGHFDHYYEDLKGDRELEGVNSYMIDEGILVGEILSDSPYFK